MKIPRWLLRIVRALLAPSRAFICMRNLPFDELLIAGGVKQGDPVSTISSIFAYDPIIKWVCSRLEVERTSCFGYCDDLGFACEDVFHDWPIIKKCFAVIVRASCLEWDIDKISFSLVVLALLIPADSG